MTSAKRIPQFRLMTRGGVSLHSRIGRSSAVLVVCGCATLALAATRVADADVPIERIGEVEVLPSPFGPHWMWVSDALLERIALVDLDSGAFLGQINAGYGVPVALFSPDRAEIYLPETHHSRRTRGIRTDVATIYDAASLSPVDEVILPPKRAVNPLPVGNSALSDDQRFLAVFNMTPATSLGVVDLEERRFAGEIPTPGCSLVYGVGDRRFAMLCGDGSLLSVTLDEAGRVRQSQRSAPFFDPELDPVTEKGVRWGDSWIFVSFAGWAHVIDFSSGEPSFESPWSLISAEDRARSWRIGGAQHLALHEPTGRLYAAVHQGGPDTHKEGGTEVWVYDIAARERVGRIELRNPGVTVMGMSLAFGRDWAWPFDGLYDFLLDHVAPAFPIEHIAVTQDEEPILATASSFSASLAVYDALSGEFLRRVVTGNMTVQALQPSPFRGLVAAGVGALP
ncbi:MAG: amine dehydrogenase large subunit [Myxococcota bacterium]|nr:amine dehydrogenase large subunit [Myxococcota bacterium]